MTPFSVLLPIYEEDDPDQLNKAINSVLESGHLPSELIILQDGKITHELDAAVNSKKKDYPNILRRYQLSTNKGLGVALSEGVRRCSSNLIARMDADDISVSGRFERQIEYMKSNPHVDVVGGYLAEFETNPDSVKFVRKVPTKPEEVYTVAKHRCPMNHPTVMFRRQAVLNAGNYSNLRSMQDYELWMRMLHQGYTLTNIPEILVKARAGDDMYGRRGGIDYAKTEWWLQRHFLRNGYIDRKTFITNVATRLPIRLLPGQVRKWIYETFVREKVT